MLMLLEIEKPNPRKSYHAVQDVVRRTDTILSLRLVLTSGEGQLDRLTHHCEIFEMNGESYRFRESMKQKKQPRKKS
jgi:hypothetical protein